MNFNERLGLGPGGPLATLERHYRHSDPDPQNLHRFRCRGAVFNVFAEQFRLELQNKGTSTITLDQVTIFSAH
jgi:hypothetical protein